MPDACAIDGCARHGRIVRGYCVPHYRQLRRRGDLPKVQQRGLSIGERFWSKVSYHWDGCWIWTGALSKREGRSYGRFMLERGRVEGAHRLSYEWFYGPISDDVEVDHLCFTTHCVNPAHLDAVTPRENVRRYALTLTHCAAGHPLTPDNVWIISDDGRSHRRCKVCDTARQSARWRAQRDAEGLAPGEYRRRTHCPKGHDMADAYVSPKGKRQCRACAVERAQHYRRQRSVA